MKELSKRVEELLKRYDFSLCGEITERYGQKGQYDIELGIYSPEGEDVIIPLIYDGTEDGFISAFVDYANDFDVEEHAEMWIEHRGENGVPESIKELLEDAEWIKDMLMKVADALNNLDEESNETDNMENRNNFTDEELTILSNGILTLIHNAGTAKTLVTDSDILVTIDAEINKLVALNNKICRVMEE